MPEIDPEQLRGRLQCVSLRFSYEQPLDAELPAVQVWDVDAVESVWEDDGEGAPIEHSVARMQIVKGSLDDPSLWDQLDAIEGDLEVIGSELLDHRGDLTSDVYDHVSGGGSYLLILNSVRVAPAWRGFGVGVMLAGLALQTLGDDAACVATFPAPLDGSQGKARKEAVRKLEKVWAQLGFQPFGGGVWILDPALVTLNEAVDSQRARFGLGPAR
jgi:GNAT superfamily N-acetyltransferase